MITKLRLKTNQNRSYTNENPITEMSHSLERFTTIYTLYKS